MNAPGLFSPDLLRHKKKDWNHLGHRHRREMNWLYFIGSIMGVAFLVALNFALFGAARARLSSREMIAAHLAREVAGFRAGLIAIGNDGLAALAEDANAHRFYAVSVCGDGLVMRELGGTTLGSFARSGASIVLRLRDLTLRTISLVFPSEEDARTWETRLKDLAV
jgi:hypothetical protein